MSKKENKVVDFNEVEENVEEVQEELDEEITTGDLRVGLLAKFRGLKWWQKAMIIAGTGTLVFIGGRWVFKTLSGNKETVDAVTSAATDAIETVVENGADIVQS